MTALWWLILSLLLLVIEMVTPGLFFFACLAAGALAAALAAWLGAGALAAWAIFFGSSALLILIVAPLARRFMKRIPASPVGLDSMVGQRAMVVETVDPATGKGQVRLDTGALWRAVSETVVPEGAWVVVLEVVGTRLKVRPRVHASSSKE